ncbi:MAG TPA: MarC family protein [Methyloceanibacter sp.]|nr:MarC family protein [Methyloceanibacter sp.]
MAHCAKRVPRPCRLADARRSDPAALIPVLRVAGGFIVAIAGWKLLSEGGQKDLEASQEERPLAGPLDQAFHPLTLPLTTGPGAIAVVISLGLSRGSYSSSTDEIVLVLSTICAVLVIAVAIFVCFAYADRVQCLLGAGGTDVAVRLSAFILFCLGIQILWAGGSELLHSVVHSAPPVPAAPPN